MIIEDYFVACPKDCRYCEEDAVKKETMVCSTCDFQFAKNEEECRPCMENCEDCHRLNVSIVH